MKYGLIVPGKENTRIEVETAKAGKFKVWVNGYEAQKVPKKKNTFSIMFVDGTSSILNVKATSLGLGIKCYIENQEITITPPVAWYAYILVFLPFVLIILGGAIGAAFGVIGMSININIIKTKLNAIVKVLLSLLVTAACYGIYVVLVTILYAALGQ